jgi:hypothetical protein
MPSRYVRAVLRLSSKLSMGMYLSEPCRCRLLLRKALDILDIVQSCPNCPTCPKGAIQNNAQKLRGCGFAKFGTIIASAKTGIRAGPDSSRHERLVAIASVALPKRECGRSLKPRKKRGMRECIQWSKGRGGLVGGRVGVPAKLGGASKGPRDITRQKSGPPGETGGVLTANPETP